MREGYHIPSYKTSTSSSFTYTGVPDELVPPFFELHRLVTRLCLLTCAVDFLRLLTFVAGFLLLFPVAMHFLRLLPVMTRRYGGGRHGGRFTGDMEGDMEVGDMEVGDMPFPVAMDFLRMPFPR